MNSQQSSQTQGSLVWGELKHEGQYNGIKVIKEAKSQKKKERKKENGEIHKKGKPHIKDGEKTTSHKKELKTDTKTESG